MQTYDSMNEKLVDILRISDEPSVLYAAQWIEELETALADARDEIATLTAERDGYEAAIAAKDEALDKAAEAITALSSVRLDAEVRWPLLRALTHVRAALALTPAACVPESAGSETQPALSFNGETQPAERVADE